MKSHSKTAVYIRKIMIHRGSGSWVFNVLSKWATQNVYGNLRATPGCQRGLSVCMKCCLQRVHGLPKPSVAGTRRCARRLSTAGLSHTFTSEILDSRLSVHIQSQCKHVKHLTTMFSNQVQSPLHVLINTAILVASTYLILHNKLQATMVGDLHFAGSKL